MEQEVGFECSYPDVMNFLSQYQFRENLWIKLLSVSLPKKELGVERDVKIIYMDLLEHTNVMQVIEKVKPDEVYNLAAYSFVQCP